MEIDREYRTGGLPPEKLSPFQKLKLMHVFGTFYDVDGSGAIEWRDFSLDLAKLGKLLNWNDEQKKTAETTLNKIWEGLRKYADQNADDKISQEEWLSMWGDCCAEGEKDGKLPGWLDEYVSFMFTANDIDRDGAISKDEYKKFFTEYGLIDKDCERAFNTVTEDGKIPLNADHYRKTWHAYFLTKDPKHPANSLFGVCYAK